MTLSTLHFRPSFTNPRIHAYDFQRRAVPCHKSNHPSRISPNSLKLGFPQVSCGRNPKSVRFDFVDNRFIRRASPSNSVANAMPGDSVADDKRVEIVSRAGMTVTFAVANRVLYKMALVPLKDYPFFLAQLTTFGYVIVYFYILYFRYRLGIVTNEMLALPKWRFMIIGALEALGVASGMAAAVHLPGPSIPVLSQTFLVWQLIFSTIILGRRYSFNQILGCLFVGLGVAIAVSSGTGMGLMSHDMEMIWPILMIAASSFQAGASILKESVFIDASKRLKQRGSVDIFVVNSFGSGFQALFLLILLPFLSSLKGIPFAQLPIYFSEGTACLVNMGSISDDCRGAPILPLLFILVNMCFNISVLSLVKISSAVVSSLTVTLSVPLSIFMFTLPLPYVGAASNLTPTFIIGAVILISGLVMYNLPLQRRAASKLH